MFEVTRPPIESPRDRRFACEILPPLEVSAVRSAGLDQRITIVHIQFWSMHIQTEADDTLRPFK
jgi:hypothetical protein